MRELPMERDGGGPRTSPSLLARARAKPPDNGAWNVLEGLYKPLVLFWCDQGGVAKDDAEDVAQYVFTAVFCDLGGFRHERPADTFRGWLRAITRNQILLHFRRNRGRAVAVGGSEAWRQMEEVPDPWPAREEGEEAEMALLYRRALEQVRCEFEESTWRACWLTAIEGRMPAALEEELGMGAAAIRQAKARVLRRIKEELGDVLA
jgi:RNA polymerase sigma-70 factor (ECF subfamily)